MIYQAKIENGIVTDVIVADTSFVNKLDGVWISCTEETLPGIGYTYSQIDGFRPPKPFPSWIWNGTFWDAPNPIPDNDNIYEWNEDSVSWIMTYMKVK